MVVVWRRHTSERHDVIWITDGSVHPYNILQCPSVCTAVVTIVMKQNQSRTHKLLTSMLKYSITPLIQINWAGVHPGTRKIRTIGFFFENRLHRQRAVRLLLFTVCTCV